MARGLKPGQCNNRAGKPKGTKNKISKPLKECIAELLEGNFKAVEKEFQALKGRDKITLYIQFLKFVLPCRVEQLPENNKISLLDLLNQAEKEENEFLEHLHRSN